jgi:hypothetical protein
MTKQVKKPTETDEERRRRLAAVFGDVLPDTTADEREPGEASDASDDWLKSQVPPHHGD